MPPNNAKLAALLQQQQCQPIYAALDSGNSRLAIQNADNLLRNGAASTSHPLARALKALALYRLRRTEEAVKEAQAVLALPSAALQDAAILTPVTYVLSRTGHRSAAASALDAASKAKPEDLELGLKAFEHLVAVADYLKAQQLAARMHKAFGQPPGNVSANPSQKGARTTTSPSSAHNRYFWWSIQAYMLLAVETPKAQGSALALTLAERLVQKHITSDDGRFDEKSDEDLELYARVLLAQSARLEAPEERAKKAEQALSLFEEEPGRSIAKRSLALGQLRLDLLSQIGSYGRLKGEAQTSLREGDRNWFTISKWIEGVVGESAQQEQVVPTAIEFLREMESQEPTKRDWKLATLTLHHRLRETSRPKATSAAFVDLVRDYFLAFGRKLCCFEDLLPFLDSFDQQEADQLLSLANLQTLDPMYAPSAISAFKTEDDVISSLNATKIRLRASKSLSAELTSPQRIQAVIDAFYASLPVSVKVPKTVPRAGTDFLLIAAQLTLAAVETTRPRVSSDTLVTLLAILTHAVTYTPASYALRLLCLRIHTLLDCPADARKIWDELKVRGIQNESLGWLWVGRNRDVVGTDEGERSSSSIQTWKSDAATLYREHEVEGPRMVMIAFERANYSSVGEFLEFDHRLQRSAQRQILDLEGAKCDVLKTTGADSAIARVQEVLRSVSDNVEQGLYDQWDLSILPSFCNPNVPSLVELTQRGRTRQLGLAYIQLQAHYLALLVPNHAAQDILPANLTLDQTTQEQLPSELTPLEVSFERCLGTLEALAAQSVIKEGASDARQAAQTAAQSSIAELLSAASGLKSQDTAKSDSPRGSDELLPWEETHHHLLALDLFHLLRRLAASSGSDSTTRAETFAPLLEQVRAALRHSALQLKEAHGSAGNFHSEAQALNEALQTTLDAQKGGKGVREKVVKDAREEALGSSTVVPRRRKALGQLILARLSES